jgi:hypothetical protein
LFFFGEATDPIASDHHRVRRSRTGPDPEGPQLVFVGPVSHVHHPTPLEVRAYVLDPATGRTIPAQITGELAKGPPDPWPARLGMEFSRTKPGEGFEFEFEFEWRHAPKSADEAKRLARIHTAYVTARWGDNEFVTSSIGWQYSPPAGAELTGRFRDSIAQGSLVIEAEVEASQPSRVRALRG